MKRFLQLTLLGITLAGASMAQVPYYPKPGRLPIAQKPDPALGRVQHPHQFDPLGVFAYRIYTDSRKMGTPPTVEYQVWHSQPEGFANNFEARMTYSAAGLPREAVISDTLATAPKARLVWDYTPSGKLGRFTTEMDLGQGVRPVKYLQYVFDNLDSNRGCDTYTVDYDNGQATLVEGGHFKNTYDAQNRLVSVIDSSYDPASGLYVITDGITYAYTGTARVPSQLTLHDTTGGTMTEQFRYDNIVWDDFRRGWIHAADIQTPIPGMGFMTMSSIAGELSANGLEHTMTTSYITDPTQPAQPVLRSTDGYNTIGDLILERNEMWNGTDWMIQGGTQYDHLYNRPGNQLSSMTEFGIGDSGVLSPADRFIYLGGTVTAAKPELATRFTLAPNPARGQVSISGAKGSQGTLVSAAGQQVQAFSLANGAATLSLDGLAPGLYQVMLDGEAAQRLVVE